VGVVPLPAVAAEKGQSGGLRVPWLGAMPVLAILPGNLGGRDCQSRGDHSLQARHVGRLGLWGWIRRPDRFELMDRCWLPDGFGRRPRRGHGGGVVVRPGVAVTDELRGQAVARDESFLVQSERIGLPACGNFLHVSSLDLGGVSKLRGATTRGTNTSVVSIWAISALNRAETDAFGVRHHRRNDAVRTALFAWWSRAVCFAPGNRLPRRRLVLICG
jgi:hypothetical protein